MKQIDVNGMLIEFDEKILLKQEIKVGDNVQILKKEYSQYKCYPGVITQLLPYMDKPAVEVMYLECGYSECSIKQLVIVAGETGDEAPRIVKMDDTFLPFTKERCIDLLQSAIVKKENELQEAKMKLEYFQAYFGKYFETNKEEQ